jgi:hypothetical protein
MKFLAATMAAVLLPMAAQAQQRVVTVTFVNYMDGRTLTAATADESKIIGSFQFGGQLHVTVTIPAPDVPVRVWWTIGDQHGWFTITSDTADYLRIDLKRRGPVGPYAVE